MSKYTGKPGLSIEQKMKGVLGDAYQSIPLDVESFSQQSREAFNNFVSVSPKTVIQVFLGYCSFGMFLGALLIQNDPYIAPIEFRTLLITFTSILMAALSIRLFGLPTTTASLLAARLIAFLIGMIIVVGTI